MHGTLLIGYGNPGRLDDGLGPALAAAIERFALPGVRVESNYQLCVEDAALVAAHQAVIFADAAVDGDGAYYLRRLAPVAEASFTTHSVTPAAVLGLAHRLFGAQTRGYALGIRGYAFNEFGERLSEPARANLHIATAALVAALRGGTLDATVTHDDIEPDIDTDTLTCEVKLCKTAST